MKLDLDFLSYNKNTRDCSENFQHFCSSGALKSKFPLKGFGKRMKEHQEIHVLQAVHAGRGKYSRNIYQIWNIISVLILTLNCSRCGGDICQPFFLNHSAVSPTSPTSTVTTPSSPSSPAISFHKKHDILGFDHYGGGHFSRSPLHNLSCSANIL